MTTIVLERPGVLVYAPDATPPDPAPGEALVRVRAVGVCGTDFHAFNGKQPFFTYPRILGHEVGVEVVAVGAGVTNVRPGDRCSVEPYVDCGQCIACRAGKGNCCERIRVLGVHADGGMRDHYVVPARKLHPSKSLGFEQLALVETLGIGAHGVARAQVATTDAVLVIGAGPIGLAALQFVRAAGARAVAMDANAERLALARRFGIEDSLSPATDARDTESALRARFGGELPNVVIDATGNQASMRAAFRLVAHGGRLTFIGLVQGEIAFDDPDFHKRELTVLASRNSLPADFRRIIGLVETGAVDTLPWITHRSKAAEAAERFPEWMKPEAKCLKGLISF
jgi:2-desacetyl-2-hydroxyethyl bacteriochlorophyllide A dehydrogenase